MSNSLVESIKHAFSSEFSPLRLDHKVEMVGTGVINSFFIKLPDEATLESKWRMISNFLAVNFQNEMEEEFQRWNLYVFYTLEAPISNRLKYLIENDTFSSRKIVVSDQETQESIIQQHISNSDLSGEVGQLNRTGQHSPNELLWNTLNGKTLKRKKRLSDATNEALDAIINSLKESQ